MFGGRWKYYWMSMIECERYSRYSPDTIIWDNIVVNIEFYSANTYCIWIYDVLVFIYYNIKGVLVSLQNAVTLQASMMLCYFKEMKIFFLCKDEKELMDYIEKLLLLLLLFTKVFLYSFSMYGNCTLTKKNILMSVFVRWTQL